MKTITCDEADKMIVTNLDEGLPREQQAVLNAHLVECRKCRQLNEQTSEILALLKEDVPDYPGEEYWNRFEVSLKHRLRDLDDQRTWRISWIKVGIVAAAVLFLVMGLVTFMPRSPEYTTRPPSSKKVLEELYLVYGPLSEDSVMVDFDGGYPNDSQYLPYPFNQGTYQLLDEEDYPIQSFM